MARAEAESRRTGQPARRFKDFQYDDAQELEPPSPRHRQGRMDPGRGQSALHRHLAQPGRGRRPLSLREGLLRARRHGEPHQGMSDGPVRRPHLGGTPCAPTSSACGCPRWPMSCSARCAASACSRPASPRQPAARSAWPCSRSAPRHDQRAARQDRHGIGLSLAARLPAGPRLAHRGRPLTNQTAHSRHLRSCTASHRGSRPRVRSRPVQTQELTITETTYEGNPPAPSNWPV